MEELAAAACSASETVATVASAMVGRGFRSESRWPPVSGFIPVPGAFLRKTSKVSVRSGVRIILRNIAGCLGRSWNLVARGFSLTVHQVICTGARSTHPQGVFGGMGVEVVQTRAGT